MNTKRLLLFGLTLLSVLLLASQCSTEERKSNPPCYDNPERC